MHPFERVLSVCESDIEFRLTGHSPIIWGNFLLNPRRLRGSDFLMRWSQGQWSEERLVHAVAQTGRYFALAYGPSGTAPDGVREYELYFERLEAAGLGNVKRPDLLIFPIAEQPSVEALVNNLGGSSELPFVPEDHPEMGRLLSRALVAVECENSLWVAKQMPGYGAGLTKQRRLANQPGLKKSVVVPTVIIKEEDRAFLRKWQAQAGVRIHIWHAFYDMAFGLALDTAEELIASGKIEPTVQTFQAPGGATTKKAIYKFYYHYAYPLGEMQDAPELIAAQITDKNGHILPYVKFQGGRLDLAPEALRVLDGISQNKDGR